MSHETFSFHASALAALVLAAGCGGRALDLGDNQPSVGSWNPPRARDGSIDETVPWTIVPGETAYALAVDASRLYWVSTTGIKSCRIDDCKRTMVTYTTGAAGSIAVSPTRLYWTVSDSSSVLSCPLDGCVGTPSVIDIAPATPGGRSGTSGVFWGPTLLLNETHVYFTAEDQTIQRCPLSGCVGKPELVAVGGSGMAADGSSIYVGANDTSLTVPPDPSGSPRALFSQPSVTFSAVDADRVYWTDVDAGTVLACPHSGCPGDPFELATGQHFANHVLVDDRNAYWINVDDSPLGRGRILECALSGCGSSPKVLASDQPLVGGGFALDEGHVYWTTLNFGGFPENHPNVNRVGK